MMILLVVLLLLFLVRVELVLVAHVRCITQLLLPLCVAVVFALAHGLGTSDWRVALVRDQHVGAVGQYGGSGGVSMRLRWRGSVAPWTCVAETECNLTCSERAMEVCLMVVCLMELACVSPSIENDSLENVKRPFEIQRKKLRSFLFFLSDKVRPVGCLFK